MRSASDSKPENRTHADEVWIMDARSIKACVDRSIFSNTEWLVSLGPSMMAVLSPWRPKLSVFQLRRTGRK